MKITVIGSGYVGLVTGACLADTGNHVLCIDYDAGKIERLKNGEIPIHEPGLDAVCARGLAAGRLRFSTDYAEAVAHAAVVFIAVGTPSDEDGSADLSHVLEAARELGRRMNRDTLVVVKSTVPVGTSDKVRAAAEEELRKRGVPHRVSVASNPEFLKEGVAVEDFMRPDRIVVGVDPADTTSRETLRELYAPFNRNHDRVLFMDVRSSEFTKYASNCMLAVRISFMNELANLADRVGVDIEQVRRGVGADPRIGPQFLYAGAGFGGSCFPKDLRALIHTSEESGEPAEMMRAAQNVNTRQRRLLADKVVQHFGGRLQGRTIALWGLAFKANTDDVREASSLAIIDVLLQAGAQVRAYDPEATANAERALHGRAGVSFVPSAPAALEGADALVVVTEWLEFRSPDFEVLARALKAKVLFDGRNLYDPAAVRKAGLAYYGIGRSGVGA
ncbi:MAG TPA: UDP-glucose/GDP-mannose dehydrogenase family protein [Ramlibacter sp.]|uniref:UDP-glucose dehydrogenase family protein n=1 Tax=Ramlibacter sp. TaxID=1917967 RepID=UPI002D7FC69B|nr:UDP-glucose/GDP-mannose dehydrogenase family protein [Ramlibacter sp.]HET8747348.1 UDP-glucose/GDP-mannose dehydrogenase family protein [Ramlibacter sp.]